MNYNAIFALLLVIALTIFFAYTRKKGFKYYEEVKLALLICGMSFKDAKIKAIADICMAIVRELEKLDMASTDKHKEAIKQAATQMLYKLGIEFDEDVLALIVDIAVAYMPENQY